MIPYLEAGFDSLLKGGVKFQIEGIPLCCLNEKYWQYAPDSIRDNMRDYSRCENCSKMGECSGIEKTYAYQFGYGEIKPIIRRNSGFKMKKDEEGKRENIVIDIDKCAKCGECEKICPVGAINNLMSSIDPLSCILCSSCIDYCQNQAIKRKSS